jgi:lipopolysaccharide biosynthesis glycosyltransferase
MKWYYALTQKTCHRYIEHVKVATQSALENTNLTPHFIYDGTEDKLTRWLRSKGVTIIFHRSSLYDRITELSKREKYDADTAAGAYLRLDIPEIERDEQFVLYTDVDVMFTEKFREPTNTPRYFALAPEKEFDNSVSRACNTGVMLMNAAHMRRINPYLRQVACHHLQDFDVFDQSLYLMFFEGLFEKLVADYNWKPYWGVNPECQIVHFHGPKIRQWRQFRSNAPDLYWDMVRFILRAEEAYEYYFGRFEEFLVKAG